MPNKLGKIHFVEMIFNFNEFLRWGHVAKNTCLISIIWLFYGTLQEALLQPSLNRRCDKNIHTGDQDEFENNDR
jgi:hypothetical protein